MKIFINDIPVYILPKSKINRKRVYGSVIREFESIVPDKLADDVLIVDASFEHIDSLLKLMTDRKLKKVNAIFISSIRKKELVQYIKGKFKVVHAAGGVVEKGGKLLLIHRKKKWDLPKGKKDEGETLEACAVREVVEETGVQVQLDEKIASVWHTYIMNKKYIMKNIHWYRMVCLNDDNMAPQKEESIKKVKWMDMEEVWESLYDSYRSIRYVMQKYMEKLERI